MTRVPAWLVNLVFGLAVTLVFYGTLEVLCRWVETGSKYRPSGLTVYELTPGYDRKGESVNDHGLRGAAFADKRGVRILAMGGSTTWGHKVDDDETWPYLLERALRERGVDEVSVLNGGVSGWGLEQVERALVERHLDALEPDIVIVYSGWNEPTIRWNSMAHGFRTRNAASDEKHWIFNSALVRRMARRIERTSRRLGLAVKTDDAPPPMPDGRPSHLDSIRENYPRLLASIARACRERGVALAVVLYPSLMDLPALPEDPFRPQFEEKYLGDGAVTSDLDTRVAEMRREREQVLATIAEAARRNEVPTLDVASRMQSDLGGSEQTRRQLWTDYFRDYAHLRPRGNEALAQALAALLLEGELSP